MTYQHPCMSVEQWWNDTDKGKSKHSGRNLSRCHFVHHNPPTLQPL